MGTLYSAFKIILGIVALILGGSIFFLYRRSDKKGIEALENRGIQILSIALLLIIIVLY